MIRLMSRIKVLAPETAAVIAAGEVVDRPVSIVKELVENALDAGADRINVAIRDGGISRIEISDNGHGISEDDIALTIERHATSKIAEADDLMTLATLGFRGEALASIAAVSNLEIVSRQDSDEHAVRMISSAGNITEQGYSGRAPGTTVIVSDLFFNTPARKKFLSTPSGESSRIIGLLEKFILAYPKIAFNVTSNDKEVLRSYGDADLFDAAVCVLGASIEKSLIQVQYATEAITVSGMLSKPEAARKSRAKQYFFVNGRIINNKAIAAALANAAKPFMISAMHPIAILDIHINPEMLDANIHPQKADVRFSDETAVFNAVYRAVKTAFTQNGTNNINMPGSADNYAATDAIYEFQSKQKPYSASTDNNKEAVYQLNLISEQQHDDNSVWAAPRPVQPIYLSDSREDFADNTCDNANGQPPGSLVSSNTTCNIEATPAGQSDITMLGSFLDAYILVQDKEDLLMIDQHAFHERVIYEKLKRQDELAQAEQMLLPEIIDLPAGDMNALLSVSDELEKIGFSIEHIGGRSVAVKAMPLAVADQSAEGIIKEIIDIVSDNDGKTNESVIERLSRRIDAVMKMIACKAAIKAGDMISSLEKEHIVRELLSGSIVPYCPHGRPVMVRLNKGAIEKMFSRKL